MFLPAADIPTFVGEGRVSLGITGRDVCAEHDAGVATQRRQREQSGESTSTDEHDYLQQGIVEVMDLEFGACKLQVQVPEKGPYQSSSDLIGKNIGTSFVHLAEEYFANLENGSGATSDKPNKKNMKTKIIELSGSVEAACALGVADGIVDLVGMLCISIVFNTC